MTKIYNIIEQATTKCKLTVTPTRVTVKLQHGISNADAFRFIELCKKAANDIRMQQCTVTFRGSINVKPGKPIILKMATELKNARCTFNEVINAND